MKPLAGVALALLAVFGLSFAISSNAPDRPPGISADRWAPISATLGVVLVPDSQLAASPAMPLPAGGPSAATAPAPGPQDSSAKPVGTGIEDLLAPPSAAVQAIIEEGYPVRGYIMVKRGKVWRPLTVVAPSVND